MKILKKNIWELKNNFKKKPLNFILRIFVGFIFAFGIFILSYYCGYKFKKYSEGLRLILPNLYKNGILYIFNYTFTVLFPLTILSSSISIISVFYKDKSLRIYLSLPLKDFEFFLFRAFKAFFISNGYIYFLIIPFVFGMGNINTGIVSIIPLSIYLFLSFLLSMILTLLMSYFFKISNLYKFFSFSFAIFTIIILLLFRVSVPKNFFSNPYLFFIHFKEPKGFFYSVFNSLSLTFYKLINQNEFFISIYYILSFLLIFAFSYFVFKLFYRKAYSRSFSSKEGKKGIIVPKIFKRNIFINLLFKEWLSIFRTPLRLTQTALMFSLIFLYFFNFQLIPLKEEPYMKNFYKGLHLFLSSFILSALGLRFSFPSISLEGKSYYIFKVLPLSRKKYLYAKGFSYFLPFSILSIILNLGAFLSFDFSLREKIFFVFYGLAFSFLTSFFAVYIGSFNPQFNNPNPLQIGFSSEGLFYFFICLTLSIFSTIYYIKDFLKLFL